MNTRIATETALCSCRCITREDGLRECTWCGWYRSWSQDAAEVLNRFVGYDEEWLQSILLKLFVFSNHSSSPLCNDQKPLEQNRSSLLYVFRGFIVITLQIAAVASTRPRASARVSGALCFSADTIHHGIHVRGLGGEFGSMAPADRSRYADLQGDSAMLWLGLAA